LRGTPIHDALESAIQKIGSTLPAQSFQFLRGLEQAIAVSEFGWKDYSRSRQVIEALTKATLHRLTVNMRHRTVGYKNFVQHIVSPYRTGYGM
jgi:hypothetical protein